MVNRVKSLVQQALQATDRIRTEGLHTDVVELGSILKSVEYLRVRLLSKRTVFKSAVNEIDSLIIPPEILFLHSQFRPLSRGVS